MDAPSSISINTGTSDSWRILLIELVHLLALFMTHARHAHRAQATAVMFDQIVRRLEILDKMPGHDGGMIIRRIGPSTTVNVSKPDYFFLFGNLAFRGCDAFHRDDGVHTIPSHLSSSLGQAFTCFHDEGINALYLQIPPRAPDKIDQLQLAMNIVARFRQAAENNATITFRYFGRVLAIPLIQGADGRPDLNLTLLAGLNGLSAVNMRKLIQQAEAFQRLSPSVSPTSQTKGAYDTIFRVRSLRSQLIKPLIEINNPPWLPMEEADHATVKQGRAGHPSDHAKTIEAKDIFTPEHESMFSDIDIQDPLGLTLSPQYLSLHLDMADTVVKKAVEALFSQDYEVLDADRFGKRIGVLSRLLCTVESQSGDPLLMDRTLCFLHNRLERLPDELVARLNLQRQGLKITVPGGSILVGMMHSRLSDLIALIKERLLVRKKMAAVNIWASDFQRCDYEVMAETFKLSVTDAETVLAFLKICPESVKDLDRFRIEPHIGNLARIGNSAFELLWCFLRRSRREQDRSVLLPVLAMLTARLPEPKRRANFLLSDLLQAPGQLQAGERDACILATYMLRLNTKEGDFYHDGTPEEVLAIRQGLNEGLKRHIARRFDSDRVRLLSKLDTIRDKLREKMQDPFPTSSHSPEGVPMLLSMERELFILMALAAGETARSALRWALAVYGDPRSDIYRTRMTTHYLAELMNHLRIVLKSMAHLGRPRDLELLKGLERSASLLMALDSEHEHRQRVKQTLQWVAPAIRAIQVQL